MQDHGLLEALGEFNLADKGLLLQFMWGAFQRVESALSHCKHLRQHKQFLKITECLIIMSGHIPWVQPGAQEMAILLRQRSATYAHQRRSRHLRQNMSMYIQNSQFSNLNSQGTGSYPDPPPGRQRRTRFKASQLPLNGPCFVIASIAYWEQVGTNRQDGGVRGDMNLR